MTSANKHPEKTHGKTPDETRNQGERASVENFRTKSHDMVDRLADKVADAEDKLSDVYEPVSESFSNTFDATTSKARSFAKEHPVATAGIAFAAGILAREVVSHYTQGSKQG